VAVALAECALGGIGAKVEAEGDVKTLFGESPSRVLISTRNPKQIDEILLRHGVKGGRIGVTIRGRLQIGNMIDLTTSTLTEASEMALPEVLGTPHAE
jgi:hypothetical protein